MNMRFDTKTGDINIGVKFEKRDIWIGLYWDYRASIESSYRTLNLYLCIVPLLPIYCFITWGWKD